MRYSEWMNTQRRRAGRRHGAAARPVSVSSVVGEILLTIGIVVALFIVYQVVWTNFAAERAQSRVSGELDRRWESDNPRPLNRDSAGPAFARLFVPTFGPDFSFAVVHGTSDADLEKGPGHYSGTQLPGQDGNFALAGHRVGRGAPFNDLESLDVCDALVVETAATWYIYRVLPVGGGGQDAEAVVGAGAGTRAGAVQDCLPEQVVNEVAEGRYREVSGRYVTVPGDVGVLDVVPGSGRTDLHDGDLAMMTLTTCHPQFSNRERLIVHAVLERSEPRMGGELPAVLQREV